MRDGRPVQMTTDYWGRERLDQAILDALAAAGKRVDSLTIDDLAPLDHFHHGGKAATVRLAHLAGVRPGMRVLDIGGGWGGQHARSRPSSAVTSRWLISPPPTCTPPRCSPHAWGWVRA
jgi:hypothetical protein